MRSNPLTRQYGQGIEFTDAERVQMARWSEELARSMDNAIMETLVFGRSMMAVPSQHRTANEVRARMEASRPLLNQLEGAFFIKPMMSGVKRWATISSHGICIVDAPGKANRTFFSMGVVKTCDESITWNSQAMERGEHWEQPCRPWQERCQR